MELARKSQLFIKDPRKLYNEYIDLKVIEKSRENDEGIYYKGVAQFSDTIKWYCNIISNELEGVLVAEGRNTNRALHEDEVYFKVISYGKEKILCSVVAIIKRRVNEIVGKIELNKSKQIYLLKPTNAKFASMNINLVDINKEWLQNVYTKYFLAKFSNWDATEDHPYCKIIE
jgi:exoribonuclease R